MTQPPCQCEHAGYCDRYARKMPAHLHGLCKHRPVFRETFARTFGLHQVIHPPPVPPVSQCRHAGRPVAEQTTPFGTDVVHACHLHRWTTKDQCDGCPDIDTENKGRRFNELIKPAEIKRPGPASIACGMVTAPRKESTVELAYASMVRAGFERPILYAEPDSVIPTEALVCNRTHTLGCWENYRQSLEYLIAHQRNADAYLIAQDDILFAEDDGSQQLATWLRHALWPFDGLGVVSLYCPHLYAKESGWHRFGKRWLWGACAFLWPRESLRHFLATKAVQWSEKGETRRVDVAVGEWAVQYGAEVWYPSPSLVQHIGHTSTIWGPGNRATGRRAAKEFVGNML